MTAMVLWVPALLTALGAYLLARLGMEGMVEVGTALGRRLRRRRAMLLARVRKAAGQERGEVQDALVGLQAIRLPAVWGSLAAGAAMAAVWHHPVLSPWFLILGGGLAWMFASTRRRVRREDLRALEAFIGSLRSVFTVGQSVFVSLQTAAEDLEPESPLREAVLEAVRRYNADLDGEKALASLRKAGSPHLARLAVVLEQVGWADEETIRDALRDLEEQVRQSRRLRDRAQTVLVLTRLTLRVLQAANLTALGAVTLLPMWHQFYAERPAMLVAATAMALAGSWYFAGELRRMEGLL